MTQKYIFQNGVMKLNPAYQAEQAQLGNQTTVARPNEALAIVSSTQDIMQGNIANSQGGGYGMQLSDATTSSLQIMQDNEFLNKFHTQKPLDGGSLLDGLSNIFAKYEVPIGLINKLLALTEYQLNFIIDDSGSMSLDSDAPVSQATPFIKNKCYGRQRMTRWEEAEDRIHVMIDMLSFIPTNSITLTFLNANDVVRLEHQGRSPEQFAQESHAKISAAFNRRPLGHTPINTKLTQAFRQSTVPTMHYLFTDGEPSDAPKQQVQQLVFNRNAKLTPLTFMSCTDNDEETEWMKEIEEADPVTGRKTPYTAELDDFKSEQEEVLKKQGPAFPFSKGFWLLCQLVAAINPDDLDAMDESTPFSKLTLDNLMGRVLTREEYFQYFDKNPNAHRFQQYREAFARGDRTAQQIINNQSTQNQGYYSQPQPPYNPQAYPSVGNNPQPGYTPPYIVPSAPPSTPPGYHSGHNPGLFGNTQQRPNDNQANQNPWRGYRSGPR